MRKEAIKGLYKVDDIYYRNVKKFLFFPKSINNEIRWWETAEWKEVWIGCGIWRDVSWGDLNLLNQFNNKQENGKVNLLMRKL